MGCGRTFAFHGGQFFNRKQREIIVHRHQEAQQNVRDAYNLIDSEPAVAVERMWPPLKKSCRVVNVQKQQNFLMTTSPHHILPTSPCCLLSTNSARALIVVCAVEALGVSTI